MVAGDRGAVPLTWFRPRVSCRLSRSNQVLEGIDIVGEPSQSLE